MTFSSVSGPYGALSYLDAKGNTVEVHSGDSVPTDRLDTLEFFFKGRVQSGEHIDLEYTTNDGHGDSSPGTLTVTVEHHVSPPPPPAPAPTVQSIADEPMQDVPVETVTLESLGANHETRLGAQAYLDQLGITEPQHQMGDQAMPRDLDLVLSSDTALVLDEHGIPVDDASIATADEHHHYEDYDPTKHLHELMGHSDHHV